MSSNSRSLNGQTVLEEDEYMDALSHIIARDFFPSLVQLDATNNYLDALRSQDPRLINESVRRLEEIGVTPRHPVQTPYGGGPSDTPLRTPSGEPFAKRPRYDTDLNLDNFQARYTSEDNSSFTEILDEENRKRKERWGWAWDAQKRVEAQRDRMLADRERLMIEPQSVAGFREKFRIEAPKPAGLIEAAPKSEEEVAIEKEAAEQAKLAVAELRSEEVVDVMARPKDTRSAAVETWSFKARNSLMFAPDADESPYRVPRANKDPDPRAIVHNSTRLPEQSGSRSRSAPPSPTRSHINAAIMGTPYRPKSPTSNNSSLVPNLPSPTPEELGPRAVKQLMTWGTLNATPRVISQSEDLPPPDTPFHIAKMTSREEISYKLANKASKSLRLKAGLLGLGRTPVSSTPKKGSMGPPSATPRRSEAAGNLTPAARRLLDRTMGTAAASRRAQAMDRIAAWDGGQKREQDLNRVRWTPK
ncbi:nuclear protein DGCR14 [Mycena amicta]|nr:nuclear protein DGCR14 [Mycena amicta]